MFLPRSPHGAKKPQETSQRVRLPITDPLEGRTDRGPKAKAASRSWLWHRGLVSRHDELNETHRIAFYDTHPGPFPFFSFLPTSGAPFGAAGTKNATARWTGPGDSPAAGGCERRQALAAHHLVFCHEGLTSSTWQPSSMAGLLCVCVPFMIARTNGVRLIWGEEVGREPGLDPGSGFGATPSCTHQHQRWLSTTAQARVITVVSTVERGSRWPNAASGTRFCPDSPGLFLA